MFKFGMAIVAAAALSATAANAQQGRFRLANADPGAAGHVLDVTTVDNDPTVYLVLLPADNTSTQVWQYRTTFFDDWRLWNEAQGNKVCAEVINTEDLRMEPCNDDLGQNWQANNVVGGLTFTNDLGGNTCLDYTPITLPNGIAIGGVVLRPCDGSASQVWQMVPAP